MPVFSASKQAWYPWGKYMCKRPLTIMLGTLWSAANSRCWVTRGLSTTAHIRLLGRRAANTCTTHKPTALEQSEREERERKREERKERREIQDANDTFWYCQDVEGASPASG